MGDSYWIIGLLVVGVIVLAIVIRYRKAKISVKAPGGFGIDAEGEIANSIEPVHPVETEVGGSVQGSTIITSGRAAHTKIAGDLVNSEVLTETPDSHDG